MPDAPSKLTHDQIRFASDARPTLTDGDYTIEVTQTLDCRDKMFVVKDDKGVAIRSGTAENPFTTKREFSVLGPRFSLDPQEIHSQFPPEGSLGEYSSVLPHVMINRLTLPWERVMGAGDFKLTDKSLTSLRTEKVPEGLLSRLNPLKDKQFETGELLRTQLKTILSEDEFGNYHERILKQADSLWRPWLALLVFHEGEEPTVVTATLKELGCLDRTARGWTVGQAWTNPVLPGALSSAVFPTLKSEYGDHIDDQVNLILLAKELPGKPPKDLESIVPSWTDLPLTAHTRHSMPDGQTEETFAALIATRLPEAGGKTTVHLVSLEGHYKLNSQNVYELKDKGQPRVFFSLASWHFACLPEKFDFAGLLKNVDAGPLRLPASASNTGQDADHSKRLAETWLAQGLVPAAHLMRQGNRSVSWYRGPLLPGSPPAGAVARPGSAAIAHADELVRFHSDVGMFDVSLAAAWELGRLLMLRDKRASLDLFHWKRAHAQTSKDLANLEGVLEHLPHQTKDTPPGDLPATVAGWFADARLLKQIPFNYLVPDERMLPAESIRFFYLDPVWLQCLLEGAFSVGFVSADHPPMPVPDARPVTGFLLRSAVVSGWPTLQVDGYSGTQPAKKTSTDPTLDPPANTLLPLLPMDRLSKNTLLCLFDGDAKTVDIHLPPQRLHFGFSKPQPPGPLFKKPRQLDGTQAGTELEGNNVDIIWGNETLRTLNLAEFSKALGAKFDPVATLNPAQFALQMIEGVEKVRFAVN